MHLLWDMFDENKHFQPHKRTKKPPVKAVVPVNIDCLNRLGKGHRLYCNNYSGSQTTIFQENRHGLL